MRWYVDRIEEGQAVLTSDTSDDELVLPLAWLPEGSAEGSVIAVALDDAAKEEIRGEIRTLQSRAQRFTKMDL